MWQAIVEAVGCGKKRAACLPATAEVEGGGGGVAPPGPTFKKLPGQDAPS